MRGLLCVLVLLLTPVSAFASDDVRKRGTCGRGASSELRIDADDGRLRTEFRVRHRRRALWRLTLVQEGVVVWRGKLRASRSSGDVRVRRELRDLPGADSIVARGVGPRGLTCSASATVAS
jgi:hypothetical protein